MIPVKEIIGNSIPIAKKCLTMEIFGKKLFYSKLRFFES